MQRWISMALVLFILLDASSMGCMNLATAATVQTARDDITADTAKIDHYSFDTERKDRAPESHTVQMSGMFQRLAERGFKPERVLDLGAYNGEWTDEAMEYWPNAEYTMVEPNFSTSLDKFLEVHENNDKVHVVYALISDKEEDVIFYTRKGGHSTGDSMYKESTVWYEDCTEIPMRSSTLDDTFPDEVFQLVKMDVQGAELAAVRGGSRLLANTMFLLLELPWYGQYNEGVASFAEHVAALDAAGFIVYDIAEMHKYEGMTTPSILLQVDVLFVHKDFAVFLDDNKEFGLRK